MKSLYGQYVFEREGKEIIEDHRGFATYQFTPEGCYMVDVFVSPDYRRGKVGSQYAAQIEAKAREAGIRRFYTSVVPSTPGATESVRAILSYGFKLSSCINNFIVFSKDI